jgi:hypothetical protein
MKTRQNFRKSFLRECARLALEIKGFRVELVPGPGIVPGARLRTFSGSEQSAVAVRTSLDREVGFSRHADGRWMTILSVDEIVVAVPSYEEPTSAEVLGFDSEVMKAAFDAALIARKKKDPEFHYKTPIFIALDPPKKGRPPSVTSGLKAKATWQTLIPLATLPMYKDTSAQPESFIERVKREFARLNGVDVSKVVVEFKIIA